MPCTDVTGQCMEPPYPFPDPIAPVCCSPYSEWYGFAPIDARESGLFSYRTCYVGINDATVALQPPDEAFWGLLCGFGCNHCLDTSLVSMVDQEGGRRWLEPFMDRNIKAHDARGMYHDLQSDEYHPVPEWMMYIRGTCWKNDGTECFGTDVCGCWGENIANNRASGGICSDGTLTGEEMPGFQFDDFFYTGDRWPPVWVSGRHFVQGQNTLYCRKFQDGRFGEPTPSNDVTKLQVSAAKLGGLSGKAEHLLGPLFISANTCNRNLLQHCVGPVSSGSDCETSMENAHPGRFWYNEDDVSRHRFDKLRIIVNNARLELSEEPVNSPSITFKNAVLAFVKSHNFEGITFDELDSTAVDPPSSTVGQFIKTFVAENDGPIIPNLLPNSRLMQSGCPVSVVVKVQQVVMRCDLVVTRVGLYTTTITFGETYGRFHIIVWLKIEASVEDCALFQSWRFEKDPLRKQTITIGEDGHTVMPDIDTIVYRNEEDRIVRPGPLVEWRGMLGGNSRPTSRSQRYGFRTLDLSGPICMQIADQGYVKGTSFLEIPGWPALIDTSPENPNKLYAGSIIVGALP